MEVVQVMQGKRMYINPRSKASFRQWWWQAVFAGSLLIAYPATAANVPQASVNKLALKAYCSEAQQKAALLANGSISYKQVADLASDRALLEHPNVYSGSAAWQTRIVAFLDQYGDEPMSELCSEDPGANS
jgi:hypothetical protein